MSRMPPVPSASRPVHGPEGVPKTSTDISHRSRPVGQDGQGPDGSEADGGIEPPVAGDDLGGAVPAHRSAAGPWMLLATGAVVAAIVWLSARNGRGSAA